MRYLQGDIVLVKFPFSDQEGGKVRPALVLSNRWFKGEDILLCGISSRKKYTEDVLITNDDIAKGALPVDSFVRLGKVVYIAKTIVLKRVGTISFQKRTEVFQMLKRILDVEKY